MQMLILFEDVNKYNIFNIINAIIEYWIYNTKRHGTNDVSKKHPKQFTFGVFKMEIFI